MKKIILRIVMAVMFIAAVFYISCKKKNLSPEINFSQKEVSAILKKGQKIGTLSFSIEGSVLNAEDVHFFFVSQCRGQ
jgi:hypothetical protein